MPSTKPKTTNQLITAVDRARDAVKALNDKLSIAKEKQEEAEADLLAHFKQEGMKSGRTPKGNGYTTVTRETPSIADYRAFKAYVLRNKAVDLFQNRISKKAWQERIDSGKKVPGVEVFKKVTLSKLS